MANTNGDSMVRATQVWLNRTYGNDNRFNKIPESLYGKTSWTTIYALTRALQIELGIKSTADNFGPTTKKLYKTQKKEFGVCRNIYGIIQGALWCKGYNTGHYGTLVDGEYVIDTSFDDKVENAVKKLENDAGRTNQTGEVDLNLMISLLSMDSFQLVRGGDSMIREIQQYLNKNYESYIGLKACDGVYGRNTNKALIYALQAEEGLPVGTANGNFGPSTKRCLPTILVDGTASGTNYSNKPYSTENINRFKVLANMALYCNGFGSNALVSNLEEETIKNFQIKYSIPATGKIDYTTWHSLFISCGDPERSAIACDCITKITEDNVSVLKNNNYKYIGRYLSNVEGGLDKELSETELKVLFNNGIRLFPIHQRYANKASYFTSENAIVDAAIAVGSAEKFKLQFGAIIYFAVDYDATDAEITNLILPYFKALHSGVMNASGGKYRVGVYGSRNICTRVCNAGYACSSFVSNMSTGFSGNLGFTIPDNWAFDQFTTTTISSNGKSIEIDKDGFSGRYEGISQEYSIVENNAYDGSILDNGRTVRLLINMGGKTIPVYENKTVVLPETGAIVPNKKVDGNIIGYIKPRDFYLRYALYDQSSDNIHRVMFNDGTDVKVGYIEEQSLVNSFDNPNNDEAVKYQILPNQDTFTCSHYNPVTNEYTIIPYEQNQEHIINKPVPYFNSEGTYQGTLQPGDIIKIYSTNTKRTGERRPWCNYVNEVKFKEKDIFEEFNMFVSIGLEYGSSGKDRAWY